MALRKIGKNWQIDYYFQGKRIREIIGPSKREAETRLGKIKAEIREGRFFDVRKESRVTFDELVEKYEENFKHQKYFITGKRSFLKPIKEYFSGKFLSEITYYDLEIFRNKRKETITWRGDQRTDATTNREIGCLRHILSKGTEWGLLKQNPFDIGKSLLVKENNSRLRFLTKEEILKLLSSCPIHLKPIVVTALNTGMRRGELLNLTWNDIQGDFIYLTKTKSKESRQIPINDDLKNLLKELRIKNHFKSQHVFCDKNGNPFKEVKRSFNSALMRAGIVDFTFHDLRHTFASWWVMRGGSLRGLKEILGHKDFKMTMRYSHLSKEYQKEEINLLDGLTNINGQKTVKFEEEGKNKKGISH